MCTSSRRKIQRLSDRGRWPASRDRRGLAWGCGTCHVSARELNSCRRLPLQVDKEAEEIFKKRIPKAFFQLLGKEPGTEDVTFQEFLVLYRYVT